MWARLVECKDGQRVEIKRDELTLEQLGATNKQLCKMGTTLRWFPCNPPQAKKEKDVCPTCHRPVDEDS